MAARAKVNARGGKSNSDRPAGGNCKRWEAVKETTGQGRPGRISDNHIFSAFEGSKKGEETLAGNGGRSESREGGFRTKAQGGGGDTSCGSR